MYFKLILSQLNEHVYPKQSLHRSRDIKDQYSESSDTDNNNKYKSFILKKRHVGFFFECCHGINGIVTQLK